MRSILAIASLAFRSAVRSRLLVSLVLVLFLAVFGLPLTIKGDGTIAGWARVLLQYALGFTMIVLGAATLWASCGSISRDIEGKQIRLVVVKPVYLMQVWFGKWLGLVAMNAVLLVFCGCITYGFLKWKTVTARVSPQEMTVLYRDVLVSHRCIPPQPESVTDEARERLARLREQPGFPDELRDGEVLDVIAQRIRSERAVVPPGASREWRFPAIGSPSGSRTPLPADAAGEVDDSPFSLRVHWSSLHGFSGPVSGTWHVQSEGSDQALDFAVTEGRQGVERFSIPSSIIVPGQALLVRFTNTREKGSGSMVFDPNHAVEVDVRQGSFGMNFARALVVIFCRLAVLTAFGLTAGALFSFPVATFSAMALVIVSLVGHYFTVESASRFADGSDHHSRSSVSDELLLQKIGEEVIKRVEVVAGPALRMDPLASLADGGLITWRFTGKAVVLLLVVYSGCLGVLGTLALRRKELALPASVT